MGMEFILQSLTEFLTLGNIDFFIAKTGKVQSQRVIYLNYIFDEYLLCLVCILDVGLCQPI